MSTKSMFRSLVVALAIAGVTVGVSAATPSTAIACEKSGAGAKKGDKPKAARVTVDATFDSFKKSEDGKIRAIVLKDGAKVRVRGAALTDSSLKQGDALVIEARVFEKDGKKVYVGAIVKKDGKVIVDASKHGRGKHKKDKA